MTSPNRRTFLQTTAMASATMALPQGLFAGTSQSSFHFIHADSGMSWAVADPVQWCLANRHDPVLERAADGLAKLTANDTEQIIRLVARRCRLNLLEVHPGQVVIHHWGAHGRAFLCPFFKVHRLARPEIAVVIRDRKHESVANHLAGDDFLYGFRYASHILPLDLFHSKWEKRFSTEPDDWSAAPGTSSGYAWEGIESDLIPWVALKSAWRHAIRLTCLNCGELTLLVNFGQAWTGMFGRSPEFVHACYKCHRLFTDDSVNDVDGWMKANLDADVLPRFEMQ